MTGRLGTAQLGALQLGGTSRRGLTSGVVIATASPTLDLRPAGGTPTSRFAAVLGVCQLGRVLLGRTRADATAAIGPRVFAEATASPLLSFLGEGGPNVGAFIATSSALLSVTGRLGRAFIATASPRLGPVFSGGLFVGTASPQASAFLEIRPTAAATGDPQLSFFIRAGQPGSCIAAQNAPAPDRPPNSAL